MAGADLSRADLSRADLSDANLSTANLSGANLAGADLAGANLRGANLASANLSGANLAGAKLHGARRGAASAGSAPSSCTSASPPAGLASQYHPPVKLTYWDTESGREATVAHKLIRQFVQAHPGIKVCAVPKPFLQTQAAFATAVQGPQAPDVLRCDVGWTTRFASKGYLLNIDSFVSRAALSDYLSAPLKYDKYQGHLYGLPQVTDFLALLYDKAELRRVGINQPPATMAALKADAVKVVERRVAKYGFETSGTSYYALPFLYAFGGGMFDRHNNILVGSSGSVNGLKFLLNLENNPHHVMPPKINIDNGPADMLNDFMYGRTAMIFDGPYSVSGLLNTRRSKFKGHPGALGVAAIPRGPAGQTGSPLGGQSYVISAATRHPAEAYEFISFMSSPASQSAISRANLTLPTRRSAYRGKVSSNLFIKEFHRISDTAIARPAIPQGAYLFDMFDPNIWAALVGVQRPGEALSAVADSWDQFGAGQVPAPTR